MLHVAELVLLSQQHGQWHALPWVVAPGVITAVNLFDVLIVVLKVIDSAWYVCI